VRILREPQRIDFVSWAWLSARPFAVLRDVADIPMTGQYLQWFVQLIDLLEASTQGVECLTPGKL